MLEKQMLMSENKLVMESLRDKETFLIHPNTATKVIMLMACRSCVEIKTEKN